MPARPGWEPAKDFLSNLLLSVFQMAWGKSSFRASANGPCSLILYLVWRILSTRRRQQAGAGALSGPLEPAWPGMDSELYLINRRLAESNLPASPTNP